MHVISHAFCLRNKNVICRQNSPNAAKQSVTAELVISPRPFSLPSVISMRPRSSRLRFGLPEDHLGQAGDHRLRPGRHPPDAPLPFHDRGRAGEELQEAVREDVRRRFGQEGLSLLGHGQGTGDALPGDGARLHLLRGGALPQAGELEPARGVLLLFYVFG